MTLFFCHLEFLTTTRMNIYGRILPPGKSLRQGFAILILDTVLFERGDVTTEYYSNNFRI
jgi:hypothetical protein